MIILNRRSDIFVALGLLLVCCLFNGCGNNSSTRGPTTTTGTPGSQTTPSSGSTTGVPGTSTTRAPPGPGQCGERRFATYAWSQVYWVNDSNSLTDFAASDMGRLWNCGDLYINVADYSNFDRIHYPDQLIAWMKKWRQASGSDGRIYLTYGDVVERNGQKMLGFVRVFEEFVLINIPADVMKEIGPIGLSFDVEHIDENYYLQTLIAARDMKNTVTERMGYPEGSIWVDSAIEGDRNPTETEYVMRYADHALMLLYRNQIGGRWVDDLMYRMRWMLTEQCAVCTQPGWENLKAKITIMVEASCEMGANCRKLSMCAFDSATYPSSDGGIEYVWNTMNELKARMIDEGLITQDQFGHLFDIQENLYAIHNWEWQRCYFGGEFSASQGYQNCADYHTLAAGCRSQ